ncbi:MAG: hypothetical protein QOD68_2425 [Actinomycetota bacterium]|jgi:hypothetical protein|nr:hypothetical protein [Actinomycetota bacterium]
MRRAAAAGLVALLVATVGAVGVLGAPTSARAAGGVRLGITTLTPYATVGTTLHVAGTVTNRGDQTVHDAVVRVRLSDTRLNSRAELAAVTSGRVASREGEVVVEAPLSDLAPGASTPFDLQQPLDDVSALTGFGVYALGIEVVGARGSGDGEPGRLAFTRSLLPWVPATRDFVPTGFSWLWPLVAAPVRLSTGVFADDSLATELETGGRLDRLLNAGSQLEQGAGLTWVLDPDLVETVADMADGNSYRVAAPDGGTVPGTGDVLAKRWLTELRAATAGRDVLALPYADPDLTALVRHGNESEIPRARVTGSDVLADLLPAADVVPGLAWPAGGYLDRDTLAALGRDDVTSVVLDGRALPPTIDLSYTPSARAQLSAGGNPVAALVADPGLVDLLGRARPRTGNPVLAAQRVVAETAMITAELPGTGTARTIVAMPPRRWDPTPEFLDQLMTMATAPWAAPVGLPTLAASVPPDVERARLRYPRSQRARELPEPYLRALDKQQAGIDNFAGILTDPFPFVPRLENGLLRLESTWWRGRENSRSIRFEREQDHLVNLRSRVRVQPGSFTFGSRSGRIPLTLINDLPQEVVVVLRLEPQTPRLRLDAPVAPQVIGPNRKIQVEVQATAVAGGPVVVEATLHTTSGEPYGQPVLLHVNVTQIGAVALVITVGAAVVLFVAAGLRVVGRVRAARRDGPDGPGDDPDDPGQPDPSDEPADVTA